MTTINPLRLGEDCLTRKELESAQNDRYDIGYYNVGRNFLDYWIIRDRNIRGDEAAIIDKLSKGYPKTDTEDLMCFINETYFITDDDYIASELYRVLHLDFVHDFASGLWFFDMFGGHELLMGGIYCTTHEANDLLWSEGADKYIEAGMGVFKSSQSPIIWIGKDTPIPKCLLPFKNKVEVM